MSRRSAAASRNGFEPAPYRNRFPPPAIGAAMRAGLEKPSLRVRDGGPKRRPIHTGEFPRPVDEVLEAYEELLARFGPQHWWPARTRFEVIVGALLMQQTAWRNVVEAIRN